jgi:hypothetical protein
VRQLASTARDHAQLIEDPHARHRTANAACVPFQ